MADVADFTPTEQEQLRVSLTSSLKDYLRPGRVFDASTVAGMTELMQRAIADRKEYRVEFAAPVAATVIDQARLVVDGDGARFDVRQKSISWNGVYSYPVDDQMGGRIIRRPDTILKIDDHDTLAGKPSVIGEPSN